ncbi:energy transducer TonB [Actimicrobium sp. CCI2.3]|uniref:energy transducer TonB n=1 Tax=Actimicrobium sp. CCI2.3 TaxID=3048616 RepID=UPI002AB551C9|nr:energy transducer TonB [Actimicrobium sp. CCI2.3]MDY7575510.1 energy transducer TonB [Actimicrobium sp. CCI2.3]MEB0023746.1 energy transducer TonB [Actimicrobium sp. CCI2.3]
MFSLLSPVGHWRRAGLLLLILLAHGALLVALQSGSPQTVVHTAPRELIASLIAPEPAPEPAPVSPPVRLPVPKVVPVVKKVAPLPPVAQATTAAPSLPPQETSTAVVAPSVPQPPSSPAPAVIAPMTAPAQPKTISGVQYLEAPQPVYPPLARRAGEEGKVILRVLVSQQGRAEQVELRTSSGFDRLDESARQSVLKARFRPHLEDGLAVAVYALVSINFSIQ